MVILRKVPRKIKIRRDLKKCYQDLLKVHLDYKKVLLNHQKAPPQPQKSHLDLRKAHQIIFLTTNRLKYAQDQRLDFCHTLKKKRSKPQLLTIYHLNLYY